MIGRLKGTLVQKSGENIVLDVAGVGYEVDAPASTLCRLPSLGEQALLFILTYVREDSIRLFGFATEFDKKVFQSLTGVTGVGPKAALALLGAVEGYELCEMITRGQIERLVAIPGIGVKTSERLVLELKTKLQKQMARYKDDLDVHSAQETGEHHPERKTDGGLVSAERANERILRRQLLEDLVSALVNLGYKDKQYREVVQQIEERLQRGEHVPLEIALKDSLRALSERILQKN